MFCLVKNYQSYLLLNFLKLNYSNHFRNSFNGFRSIIESSSSSTFCTNKNVFKYDDETDSGNTNQIYRKTKQNLIYRNLFDWNNEIELIKYLQSNIVYNKNGLVVLNKPWGLGIHQSKLLLNSKNPSFVEQQLNQKIFGQSNFCINDVLDLLSQSINIPNLYIIKALDRRWSGLLLLSKDPKMKIYVKKSIERAKTQLLPYMHFYCIVNGMIQNAVLNKPYVERCGIRLADIDEFGKQKEPIYVSPKEMSQNMRKRGAHRSNRYQLGPVKTATVQYKVLATNPKLSVSLIDFACTTTKWSLIQCFLAYKTSFVLGDNFFSHRVKHILGQPITMAVLKQKQVQNWQHLDQNFEPLSKQVCERLGVRSNQEIPLMIHHYGLVLPGLLKSIPKKSLETPSTVGNEISTLPNDDLIVQCNQLEYLPQHFLQTLDRLELNIFRK